MRCITDDAFRRQHITLHDLEVVLRAINTTISLHYMYCTVVPPHTPLSVPCSSHDSAWLTISSQSVRCFDFFVSCPVSGVFSAFVVPAFNEGQGPEGSEGFNWLDFVFEVNDPRQSGDANRKQDRFYAEWVQSDPTFTTVVRVCPLLCGVPHHAVLCCLCRHPICHLLSEPPPPPHRKHTEDVAGSRSQTTSINSRWRSCLLQQQSGTRPVFVFQSRVVSKALSLHSSIYFCRLFFFSFARTTSFPR